MSSPKAPPTSFDISQLPSLKKDGMSIQEEAVKRRKTCRFLEEAGRILKLPRIAIATAMVFFHRFYAKHAFSDHDRFEVAVACLLLAAKTEESPKKLVLVIDECYKLKSRGLQAAGGSSAAPPVLDQKGEEFQKLKERILLLERVTLHTIGFELSIDHPYKFLVEQIKELIQRRHLDYAEDSAITNPKKTGSKLMNEMVQFAMNFANDSMHTSLCLQFDARCIASACVYLAANFCHARPKNNSDWLELLHLDAESLGSIALQMVELIAERRGANMEVVNQVKKELQEVAKLVPDAKRQRVN